MRASAYNLRIRDREDRYCLFNTRRGSARLLDQQEYLSYWSADSGESSLNDAGDLVMQLADDGFLVENDTNELANIEAEHLGARRSRGKVSLIIAPTMACNLDCSYCFETNRYAGRMSDQTQNQLVGLVRHYFETGTKRLAMTRYAGEPETCKAASDRLLERHSIYIEPINYPTVPCGTERLRITPTPYHCGALIEELARVLAETWQALRLPLEDYCPSSQLLRQVAG
jgi:hypothetical protein